MQKLTRTRPFFAISLNSVKNEFEKKSWSNALPELLSCIEFLCKVVHKIGRLRKFIRVREIEFNFLTARTRRENQIELWVSFRSVFSLCEAGRVAIGRHTFSIRGKRPFSISCIPIRRCPTSGFGNRMTSLTTLKSSACSAEVATKTTEFWTFTADSPGL